VVVVVGREVSGKVLSVVIAESAVLEFREADASESEVDVVSGVVRWQGTFGGRAAESTPLRFVVFFPAIVGGKGAIGVKKEFILYDLFLNFW